MTVERPSGRATGLTEYYGTRRHVARSLDLTPPVGRYATPGRGPHDP